MLKNGKNYKGNGYSILFTNILLNSEENLLKNYLDNNIKLNLGDLMGANIQIINF